MKFIHTMLLALVFITACQSQTASKGTTQTSTQLVTGPNRIEVIDFHTNHRCKTCLKIEDNTQKLLTTVFLEQFDEGIITFKTVNIDEKENYELAQQFQAAGTALFLNVVKDGSATHIDLTDFAFMRAFDDELFASELTQKINEQLKEL